MSKTHSILVKLTESQYRCLERTARGLDLSVAQTVRALIPNLEMKSPTVLRSLAQIAEADPFDRIPTGSPINMEDLRRVLSDLRAAGAALTLAAEVERSIVHEGRQDITVATYARLGRWCSPRRWTSRERAVEPAAKRLSACLFGRVVDRID